MTNSSDYLQALNGSFVAILRWPQLDQLWQTLRDQHRPWWVYEPTQPLPNAPLRDEALQQFLQQLDQQLRHDHQYDYCGIVYVDDLQQPTLIKIYHPGNLGVSCGISVGKPLPGWILSQLPPQPLGEPAPAQQKFRWWRGLTGKKA